MKLDIAAGQNKKEGFTGIDIMPGSDIVHDLEVFPWPIESDSVEEAHCSHFIEHVKNFGGFFDELYRILKVGAKCTFIAPYYTSVRAWQDFTHVRAISEATFLYINKEWRKVNKLDHYPIHCDFDFTYGYSFHPNWASRNEQSRAFAVAHYNNVVTDIMVTVTKRKE